MGLCDCDFDGADYYLDIPGNSEVVVIQDPGHCYECAKELNAGDKAHQLLGDYPALEIMKPKGYRMTMLRVMGECVKHVLDDSDLYWDERTAIARNGWDQVDEMNLCDLGYDEPCFPVGWICEKCADVIFSINEQGLCWNPGMLLDDLAVWKRERKRERMRKTAMKFVILAEGISPSRERFIYDPLERWYSGL